MTHEWPVETASAAETEELGRRVSSTLTPGDIVALYGDLGAGKTRFAAGIALGLGAAAGSVTSPTFTIVQEYACGSLTLFHVDAYRTKSLDELLALGIEDVLFGDGISVIEWPGLLEPILPPDALRLRLTHLGQEMRRIDRVQAGG